MLTKEERRRLGAEVAGILKKNPEQFILNIDGELDMQAVFVEIGNLVSKEAFIEHINSIMGHARNFYNEIFQFGHGKWGIKNETIRRKYMAEKAAAKKQAKDRLGAAIANWPKWREFLEERVPISFAKKEIIGFIGSLALDNEHERTVAQTAFDLLKSGRLPDFLQSKAKLVHSGCIPPFLADINSDWESHVHYFKRNDPERWEKIKVHQEKYMEKYFKKHKTTEAEALKVWKKIGGIGPMPVPGFWNVGREAHFSRCALGLDKEFSLLGHHGMRYRPKSLTPVGIGHTPYGEMPVYRTADVIDYKKQSEERRAKQRPPHIFGSDLSTLVACLVIVNRYARRLSRMLPSFYQLDMHGLCSYWKQTKNILYELKNDVLLRLANRSRKKEWHLSEDGWLLYLVFALADGKEYGFHLPCEPDKSVLPDEEEAEFIDFVPVMQSPRFKVKGRVLRLKDAIATLRQFVRTTEIPGDCKKLQEWHQRSKEKYDRKKISCARGWKNDWEDDWEDDWENGWEDD
ncbi:MAG: hypothetical protein K6T65_05440 [Peptococcaceae bacterium]|nr:hypothetical protein [Peptococcaceae bacterium]